MNDEKDIRKSRQMRDLFTKDVIDSKKRTFAWANISGEYKQDRSDWKMMCYSCHKKYDIERIGYIAWNKGNRINRERICLDCSNKFHANRKNRYFVVNHVYLVEVIKQCGKGLYLKRRDYYD